MARISATSREILAAFELAIQDNTTVQVATKTIGAKNSPGKLGGIVAFKWGPIRNTYLSRNRDNAVMRGLLACVVTTPRAALKAQHDQAVESVIARLTDLKVNVNGAVEAVYLDSIVTTESPEGDRSGLVTELTLVVIWAMDLGPIVESGGNE